MNRREREREDWVTTTQMFQRVAKVPVDTAQALREIWDRDNAARRSHPVPQKDNPDA